MIIGIPKEHRAFEYRVGVTPVGVAALTADGHTCYVESGAGLGGGFSDQEYEKAGGRIAYRAEEVFQRADLILKVQRPTEQEAGWMRSGQTIMAFMLLMSASQNRIQILREKNVTAIAYELITEADGTQPILYPSSQIGGRMTAQIAAQYLQNDNGGKGILLGGIAGIPSAEVVIIGAGVVGLNAAEAFLGLDARVILMDHNLHKLQAAHDRFGGRVTTMMAHPFNLAHVCKFADVIVGAVQVIGQPAPRLITREMVKTMKPRSLIIDMSIDQGGCFETSRPTRHDDPVYVVDEVLHYCVPNVPGVVGRTATHAFLNAAWPYIKLVSEVGVDKAIEMNMALEHGVVLLSGKEMPMGV